MGAEKAKGTMLLLLFVLLPSMVMAWMGGSSHRVLFLTRFIAPLGMCAETPAAEGEVTSKEIVRMSKKIEELTAQIREVKEQRASEEAEQEKLDAEYGGEIARVKKEFARMKERAIEEATDASNKAKTDALKEVLPITDNYFRAKPLFEPLQTDSERAIYATYDEVFTSFSKVIESFGVTRVVSIGQPFDYNFMEAIMSAPSTEYKENVVTMEYQVGYKIGDKCIRPSMVVVSTGPGPSSP